MSRRVNESGFPEDPWELDEAARIELAALPDVANEKQVRATIMEINSRAGLEGAVRATHEMCAAAVESPEKYRVVRRQYDRAFFDAWGGEYKAEIIREYRSSDPTDVERGVPERVVELETRTYTWPELLYAEIVPCLVCARDIHARFHGFRPHLPKRPAFCSEQCRGHHARFRLLKHPKSFMKSAEVLHHTLDKHCLTLVLREDADPVTIKKYERKATMKEMIRVVGATNDNLVAELAKTNDRLNKLLDVFDELTEALIGNKGLRTTGSRPTDPNKDAASR